MVRFDSLHFGKVELACSALHCGKVGSSVSHTSNASTENNILVAIEFSRKGYFHKIMVTVYYVLCPLTQNEFQNK